MSELNQDTEQAPTMAPATSPTAAPAEPVGPVEPAEKLSEYEQKLKDSFDQFTQHNKSDPRVYFHAMEFDRKWLSRTNAYEVACTLMADAFACFTNRHNVAPQELLKAYVGLSTSKGAVSVLQLARKVVDLRNSYRGEAFLQSTVTGYRFRVECDQDGSNSDVYLTKDEMFVKLDVAKFKSLVKAFRLYVECACARMFPRNLEMKKWNCESATYTDDRSGNKRTSIKFAEFARELLNVHWKLCNFTEELAEVESVMVRMKAASQKAHEMKKLNTFAKTGTLDRPKGHNVKKNLRSDVADTKRSSNARKFTVMKPVGPPPSDAWKNGNPIVKAVEPVETTDNAEEPVETSDNQAQHVEKGDHEESLPTNQETSGDKPEVKSAPKHTRKIQVKGKSDNKQGKRDTNDGQWHTVRSKKNSVNKNGNRAKNDNDSDKGPREQRSYNNTRRYERPLR